MSFNNEIRRIIINRPAIILAGNGSRWTVHKLPRWCILCFSFFTLQFPLPPPNALNTLPCKLCHLNNTNPTPNVCVWCLSKGDLCTVHAKAVPKASSTDKIANDLRRINRNCMDSNSLQILVKTTPPTLSPHSLNNIMHVGIYPHPSHFHHSGGKDTPRLRGVW